MAPGPVLPIPMPVVLPMLALDLSASVGVKGKNVPGDVLRVQDALNAIPAAEGTPSTLLHPDGIAGPKTCAAIQNFQLKHFGWKIADGRIDPDGRTAQLISSLILLYCSDRWNVRRLESAQPATANVAGVRTINSRDRLFELADLPGVRRALYYFRAASEPHSPRADQVPPLDGGPEFNAFATDALCSPYAFVGHGTYSEMSSDATHVVFQLTIQPTLAHVAKGALKLQVRHEWIHPISTPGVGVSFAGVFSFVRDESLWERKRRQD